MPVILNRSTRLRVLMGNHWLRHLFYKLSTSVSLFRFPFT
jgi:hypothetical protein